jgi:hypothetical protein
MEKPHKLHARTTILIIRPSQTPTSTSCHVKVTEPCAYFYIWDFSLVGIMQWFSTQRKFKLSTYDMGAHFQSILHFIFRFLNGTWNVFATKRNLCPSTRWAWGLNIHDGKWAFVPHMINKLAIQPQIKHNQATKICQDHIKTFTHERAHMWHFSKNSHQPWIINQDHQELSQTNYIIPN